MTDETSRDSGGEGTGGRAGGARRPVRRTAHAPYDELVAGYALGALEPEDEQLLVLHLPECERCSDELAAHQDALFALVDRLDEEEPPASLLAGIRAGIGIDDQALAGNVRRLPTPAERAARRWRPSGRSVVSAAAAVALVASLGVWSSGLRTDRDATTDRFQALVSTLRLDDARTVQLRAEDGSVAAFAVLGERGSKRVVAVVADGLPANDATAGTYVLWAAMRFGDVRPVGTFDVTGKGPGVVAEMVLEQSVTDVAGFAVTEEPGRTAPALPSKTPIVTGDLRADSA